MSVWGEVSENEEGRTNFQWLCSNQEEVLVSMSICGPQGDLGQIPWGLFKGQTEPLYSGRGELNKELMFSGKEAWTNGNLLHEDFPPNYSLPSTRSRFLPIVGNCRLSLSLWNTSSLHDLWCAQEMVHFTEKYSISVTNDIMYWSWQLSFGRDYIFHFAKKKISTFGKWHLFYHRIYNESLKPKNFLFQGLLTF